MGLSWCPLGLLYHYPVVLFVLLFCVFVCVYYYVVYVWVCMYARIYVGVNTRVHVYVEVKGECRVPSLSPLSLLFEIGFLTESGTHRLARPASQRLETCLFLHSCLCTSTITKGTEVWGPPNLPFMGCWWSKSGLNVCVAGTKPSLQLQCPFISVLKSI